MLEQQVGGVAAAAGVIVHHRLAGGIAFQEFAIEPHVAAIKLTQGVEGEVRDHVVGLQGIFAKGLGIADGETAVLRLVIEVLQLVTGFVNHEYGMVHGLVVTDRLHAHVDVVGVDGLETAKLVASRKNQVPVVLIGHMVHSNHRGAVDHHSIVVTGILRDNAGEFAIGVLDLVRLVTDVKGHLLETVVVLDIGAGSDLRKDAHLALTHRESRLEQDLAGVILLIDTEQIVAAHQKLHVAIRQRELVVVIVDVSGLTRCIVVDIGIIEAAHILALDQLRRLPVGIAMGDAVTQIVHVIVQIVEVDQQTVVAVHHQHRRDVHIAGQTHLERAHIVVKNVDTRVHLALSHSCHGHQAARQ